jgi:hypothetical protein
MENTNFENNDKKIESVYSTRIRAGKRRTYFFDVRATRANDYFLTITESRKRFDNNGYDRHKIFLYKEDFNKFLKAITEALDYVKTELMPDFDFDAFNHDNPEGYEENGENYVASAPTEFTSVVTEQMITQLGETTLVEIAETSIVEEVSNVEEGADEIVITEKKPLEARESVASAGDNLSGEEVDKW